MKNFSIAGTAGGSSIASFYQFESNSGEVYVGTNSDIAAWLNTEMVPAVETFSDNTTGGAHLKVVPKTPTFTVGPYTWSSPDRNRIRTATADVTATFADGSSFTETLVFNNYYPTEGQIYGAKMTGNTGTRRDVIDTGLKLNYAYEIEGRGYVPSGLQGVFAGAVESATIRTTARFFGGSNFSQPCWPSAVQVTSSDSGINFRSEFRYVQNASGITFKQNGVTYTETYSGTASGTGSNTAPIYLFDEVASSTVFNDCILCEVIIRDAPGGTVLRHFVPWMTSTGEVVMKDIENDRLYRTVNGTALVEVLSA